MTRPPRASAGRRLGCACLVAPVLCGCVSFAAPPPMATLGGPHTAGRHASQLGLGVGSGVSLFSDAHSGGLGYLGRFRFGLTEWLDLGIDALGYQRGSKGGITGKIAGRARVHRHSALELGLGAADDSDGKSLNLDTAVIAGTDRGAVWDLYGALRIAGALGITHNPIDAGDPNTLGAQDALLGLAALGASARVLPRARFIFEGGYSLLVVRHAPEVGQGLYLGLGLVFQVGGEDPGRTDGGR